MQLRSVRSALLALGLVGVAASAVRAQDVFGGSGGSGGSGGLGASSGDAPGLTVFSADTQRPDQGLALAGWMLYPSFYAGGIYNDNVYAARADRIGIPGVQISPSLEVNRDDGLFKTDASFTALITAYPGAGPINRYSGLLLTKIHDAPPTNFTGNGHVTETWTPREDLTVTASGNVYRSNGLFGTGGNGTSPGAAITPSSVLSLASVSARNQYINSFGSQLAVEKNIDERTSVRASGYFQGISYDNTQTVTSLSFPSLNSVNNSQNGLSYGTTLRGSFNLTPRIYVYVVPNMYFRKYENYAIDANGYTINAGIGSNLIGLFSGEIYGGYQEQWSVYRKFGTLVAPSYGFRINYFPTPLLTLTLNASTNLTTTDATGLGLTSAQGIGLTLPTSVFSSIQNNALTGFTQRINLQAEYGLNNYTTVTTSGGFFETKSSGRQSFTQQAWFASTKISYNFWRNTSIDATYSFVQTAGTRSVVTALGTPPLGFQQNVFSAGLRYSY
jgi:hypothetical protein